MSRCRCSDISNTENKIRKLESAKGIMSGYSSASGRLESELQQWANVAKQATISAKIASDQSKMTTLGKGMNQAADGISGKINAKLNELRSALNSMRSEDHNYHEEQRRRREEEERRRAEEAARAAAAAKNFIKW